jgi:hypothetical protein
MLSSQQKNGQKRERWPRSSNLDWRVMLIRDTKSSSRTRAKQIRYFFSSIYIREAFLGNLATPKTITQFIVKFFCVNLKVKRRKLSKLFGFS